QHWNTLGVGNPRIQTRHLDRLCREGTRLTRAYCPNPTCTPTRASIITGLYPSMHGAWSLGTKLPEDVPTVGDVFQQHGYATTIIGKAHFQPLASTPEQTSIECQPTLRDLEFWRNFYGPWYGFEHVETARMHADEYHAGGHYGIWMEDKGLLNWRDYFQSFPPDPQAPLREHVWDLPEEFHYTRWTAERTIADIEKHVAQGEPFFTWASFHDPHPPYLTPQPWASMYDPAAMEPGTLLENEMDLLPAHFRLTQQAQPDFAAYAETEYSNHGFYSHLTEETQLRRDMAVYYGMISFMDQQIGRILDALDSLNITENTLVVFSTDHGHFLGQHGLVAKGAFHYEDLLRLPFIVRWPQQIPAGRQSAALQSLVDLAPTFLAACGIPVPGLMQGVDQMPVWRGASHSVRDEVLVEFRHQPTKLHLRTYIDERYKITLYRDQVYGELFDLHEDPDERYNRWDDTAYASIKCELLRRFENAEIKREPTRLPRIANA
ncbi:MAG TPA: sulfatase-like hydrolase/transferase, partial [Abditibacteriaceae bacterium]|nr:sulfatase-like hydrolase/transferase [Abditibacteriaceae bacterium]